MKIEPNPHIRWRGKTLEIDCWFPQGFTEEDLKTWCKENLEGEFLVCHPPGATSGAFSPTRGIKLGPTNIAFRMHVKLANPDDMSLFILTWC